MDKEKMQDIKERLDLFPSNMNEPAQKAYCELFDYLVFYKLFLLYSYLFLLFHFFKCFSHKLFY